VAIQEAKGTATTEALSDADDAAADAHRENFEMQKLVSETMQCQNGRGKILEMEKKLTQLEDNEGDNAIKKDIEKQIVKTNNRMEQACRNAIRAGVLVKQDAKKAKKAKKKVERDEQDKNTKEKKEMAELGELDKQMDTLGEGTRTHAGKGSKTDDMFKVIVEHGAVTAEYTGPKTKYPPHIVAKLATMEPFDNKTSVDPSEESNNSNATGVPAGDVKTEDAAATRTKAAHIAAINTPVTLPPEPKLKVDTDIQDLDKAKSFKPKIPMTELNDSIQKQKDRGHAEGSDSHFENDVTMIELQV